MRGKGAGGGDAFVEIGTAFTSTGVAERGAGGGGGGDKVVFDAVMDPDVGGRDGSAAAVELVLGNAPERDGGGVGFGLLRRGVKTSDEMCGDSAAFLSGSLGLYSSSSASKKLGCV